MDELRHAQDLHRARSLDLRGLQMADGDGLLLLPRFVVDGVELHHLSGYLAALLAEAPDVEQR